MPGYQAQCCPLAGQRQSRHRVARGDRENAQHLALAIGEMHDFLAVAQLAALEMKHVGPERHGLQRFHPRRGGALEDIADPQDQLTRLERLGDIIVGADLQAFDPAFRLGACGQHDDRHR